MIYLSNAAIREVNRLKLKQPTSQVRFRLGVEPGGCVGMSYTLTFDHQIQSDDRVLECEGVQVVVADRDWQYLNTLSIDYSEDLMGGGFRFQNPNAVKSCSCSHSFAIETEG
jgi:iron-sulfur cluster assembly protein